MIKNVDISFFRNVLEFDDKTYTLFFDFVSDILDLEKNITKADFLVFEYKFINQFIDNKYSFEGIDDTLNKFQLIIIKMNY